jgi:hypothetical protein
MDTTRAVHSPSLAAMTTSDTNGRAARSHTREWLIALLIAFILGFVLAWWLFHHRSFTQPLCPQPSQPAPATSAARAAQSGGGGKHGAPGKGSPDKLNGSGRGNNEVVGNGAPADSGAGTPASGGGNGSGKVSGGGNFDVSGKLVVNGTAGGAGAGNAASDTPAGGGGNGDLKLPPAQGSAKGDVAVNATPGKASGNGPDGSGQMDGGGTGNPQQGDAQSQPSSAGSAPHAITGNQPVTPSPGGALQLGPPMGDSAPDASRPNAKVVTALDYRYDKSGLPHYPNALKVASGTDAAAAAAAAGPNAKNFSITEIITDDAPDVAAAWYHDHLPAGWNELSMPSAAAMDQATAQANSPAANSDPVSAMLNSLVVGPQLQRDKPGIDAARAAGLTIFQPADPNTDRRMILVIRDSKTGKTGVLLMKKADVQ